MKEYILMLIILQAVYVGAWAQEKVKGRVVDAQLNEAIPGAVIKIPEKNITIITDAKGEFELNLAAGKYNAIIQSLGYLTKEMEIQWPLAAPLTITLKPDETLLNEVEVVNTGYQKILKENLPGSYTLIDNKIVERGFSTNLVERLDGLASGLVFIKGGSNPKINNISIRGLSTLYANNQPLIIVDNFEYEGDIRNINPNDIENITLLKDASASAIWGAKAGNGVIVITTKSGLNNQNLNVNFLASYSQKEIPDLYNTPQISSLDYIELEKFLYDKGYYNSILTSVNKTPVSPVVELLELKRLGKISQTELDTQLSNFSNIDYRNSFNRLFMQLGSLQQYALNISGGSNNSTYYLSIGKNYNKDVERGNGYNRTSINLNNTYKAFKNKLELNTHINYTISKDINNYVSPTFNYPYVQFEDQNGLAASIDRYRRTFIDTISRHALLDWQYRPLDELGLYDNTTSQSDLRFNAGLKYNIFSNLSASIKYQYGFNRNKYEKLNHPDSYFVRDLINQYSLVNYSTGAITRPIPLGGILDFNDTDSYVHKLRLQADYNKSFNNHSLMLVGGAEASDQNALTNGNRFYGYDENRASNILVDYLGIYKSNITGRSNIRIPTGNTYRDLTNRFISIFANANYNWNQKYYLQGSIRKDAANIFGVKTNQKWIPLWSVGGTWVISKENYFKSTTINQLKIRGSYGYSGNIDRTVSASLVAQSNVNNVYNLPTLVVRNPPNDDLRWEKIGIMNLGVDLALLKNRISISVDAYQKAGKDIMGFAELAPSSGLSTFKGNTAEISGKGIDFILNTKNTDGLFKWSTVLLINHNQDKIVSYKFNNTSNINLIRGEFKIGNPINSIYSFKWKGLSGINGDPIGFINNQESDNYGLITNSTNYDDLTFHGSGRPTWFGGFRNNISYKNVSLSFNITFKAGYFFRAPALNYTNLFGGSFRQTGYTERWQVRGDEKRTNVPSLVYPAINLRDQFYQYSSINVVSGTHLRLADLLLSYNLKTSKSNNTRSILFTAHASNIGLIWTKNNLGLDPDSPSLPLPVNVSFGLKYNY